MLDITTQESAVYHDWIKRFAVNEGFIANSHNSEVIDAWLDSHNKNYSYDSLNDALESNRSKLDGVLTLEQKQEIARQKQIADHNNAVAAAWLADECPLGLLYKNDVYESTQQKLIAFIKRNWPGTETITPSMLSEGVKTLDASLDWFSSKPEDHVLRNQPKPEPRMMSDRALIDAGMKAEADPRNHANDSKLKNPADLLRPIVKKMLGKESPDQNFCEHLSVSNRFGRVDHGFLAKLRETLAHNRDGSVNWAETRRLRVAACDSYEKQRNRV